MGGLSEVQPRFNNSEDSSTEALESVQSMLRSASSSRPLFPPTLLYNEGWLLRLVLDWFAKHSVEGHPLSFSEDATWFSEALLPSAFLARHRGDNLAESWTHADGVVGHFLIGEAGKADLKLMPEANQFIVLEAKMFSGLSSGVSNARYYDQAARNVACMAEVLNRASRNPTSMTDTGFYVLAPKSQIEKGLFADLMNKDSISGKVTERISAYDGKKDAWYRDWFLPTLDQIKVLCLSWEEIITYIQIQGPATGDSMKHFYEHCYYYNQ